jgi:hypothetical protein
MSKTITLVYPDYLTAERVVRELKDAGLSDGDISIVASNADGWHKPGGRTVDPKHDKDRDGRDDRAEGAAAGGTIGVVAGGAVGVLTGLGLLAIPGVGPVVAAGWLATLAAGAAAGGVTGGLVGALVESGTSKENAELYAEAVRRGGAVVTANVPNDEESAYLRIMETPALDLEERVPVWRQSGWKGYDPSAPAFTPQQVREERDSFRP